MRTLVRFECEWVYAGGNPSLRNLTLDIVAGSIGSVMVVVLVASYSGVVLAITASEIGFAVITGGIWSGCAYVAHEGLEWLLPET